MIPSSRVRFPPSHADLRPPRFEPLSVPGGGDLMADLFGGSGSTLIACERRNRKARLMELDPKYADCIVQRWQDYTGKQATLDDGRTFEEIAQERRKEAA